MDSEILYSKEVQAATHLLEQIEKQLSLIKNNT